MAPSHFVAGANILPEIIQINTRGKGAVNITARLNETIARITNGAGVAHVFVQHTSASLIIQENADPDVLADLATFFDRVAPEEAYYRHDAEGSDDMPAHIRAAITATTLSIPVAGGRLMLGTWQGVYLWEHRRNPHQRNVVIVFTKEG